VAGERSRQIHTQVITLLGPFGRQELCRLHEGSVQEKISIFADDVDEEINEFVRSNRFGFALGAIVGETSQAMVMSE